jgi:hypothetical protein
MSGGHRSIPADRSIEKLAPREMEARGRDDGKYRGSIKPLARHKIEMELLLNEFKWRGSIKWA